MSPGISPENLWKGRERISRAVRSPSAGVSWPESLRAGSGQEGRNGPDLEQEGPAELGSAAEMLRATTREEASHATPGQEQWSVWGAHWERRPNGSDRVEFLKRRRAERSAEARGSGSDREREGERARSVSNSGRMRGCILQNGGITEAEHWGMGLEVKFRGFFNGDF